MPDLKFYYRAIVIKNCMVLVQWQVDEWNRIEDPEMNPYTCGYLIFDKEAKKTAFSTNGAGSTGS